MKGPSLFILLLAVSITANAQIRVDSAEQRLDAVTSRLRVDSVQERLQHLPDSLLPTLSKVDSIRNGFNTKADSLKSQYQKAIGDINTQSSRLNHKIDSLKKLNLRTNKYERSLRKLSDLRQKTEGKFNEKLTSLKSKTTDKLNALDLPPEYKEPIQKLTKQIDGLNINNEVLKIPELKIPGYDLPNMNGIGEIPSLNGIQNPADLGNIPKVDVPKVDLPTGEVANVTQQVQGYQEDIKNITSGNLDDVEKLPESLESQAGKIDGMDELQKQSGIIDEQKGKLDVIKDPEQAKEKAVEMAKKAAVDHFAGKEEQLKAAMEKISKYKQKYSSVSSIKDLPKRPPNPMKGKPFVERVIPGLYFQYQQKNFYLLDVNPYVGYKISGRFNAGMGWNRRFAYDSKYDRWNKRSRIFGPRAYVDFKLGKGFIAHVEGEAMNSFVPSTLLGNPDAGQREWVLGCMTGIKKEYRIYKNLKGTALIQYNLFNRFYKAPYVDRLNSRVGFEYTLKAESKKQKVKSGKQKAES